MSDVMHGPKVRLGRSRRKTYLIAFIDDATRVVPFAAFAMSENVPAFLPVWKNALIRRGLPARLYVDNGAAYRSRQLALVCAKLGVVLVHARPYQPAGKGKIERFFRTLRAGWLAHLDARATDSVQTLNRSLWAWIEGEYHNTPHRGLDGRTPLEQWALVSGGVRYPDATLDLDEVFLFEAKRVVHKDRTVSLNGRLYEVDAILVGQRVILRYDPHAPPTRPLDVVHEPPAQGRDRLPRQRHHREPRGPRPIARHTGRSLRRLTAAHRGPRRHPRSGTAARPVSFPTDGVATAPSSSRALRAALAPSPPATSSGARTSSPSSAC